MAYKCNLTKDQIDQYKTKLHKKIFWFLLYKDPKTASKYPDVNIDSYFEYVIKELDGFNKVLSEPPEMAEILSLLEAAHRESKNEKFNYRLYRKFILDAQDLVDQIGGAS